MSTQWTKGDIESLLAKIQSGDRSAVVTLKTINLAALDDESFDVLLPWFNLSEKAVRGILEHIAEELQKGYRHF